jgi:hypothetical protein
VLTGTCDSLATPTPLGPFLDVAAQVGGAVREHVQAGADARTVATALVDELRGTSVLVLEDVHWADEATLDVVRVLGKRVERTSSLLIATYREDEIEGDHPLRLVLGELASTGELTREPQMPLATDRSYAAPASSRVRSRSPASHAASARAACTWPRRCRCPPGRASSSAWSSTSQARIPAPRPHAPQRDQRRDRAIAPPARPSTACASSTASFHRPS